MPTQSVLQTIWINISPYPLVICDLLIRFSSLLAELVENLSQDGVDKFSI